MKGLLPSPEQTGSFGSFTPWFIIISKWTLHKHNLNKIIITSHFSGSEKKFANPQRFISLNFVSEEPIWNKTVTWWCLFCLETAACQRLTAASYDWWLTSSSTNLGILCSPKTLIKVTTILYKQWTILVGRALWKQNIRAINHFPSQKNVYPNVQHQAGTRGRHLELKFVAHYCENSQSIAWHCHDFFHPLMKPVFPSAAISCYLKLPRWATSTLPRLDPWEIISAPETPKALTCPVRASSHQSFHILAKFA